MNLQRMMDPRFSALWLVLAIVIFYVAIPTYVQANVMRHPNFPQLSAISLLGCALILIGFYLPLFDFQFRPTAWRIPISETVFQVAIWGLFAAVFAWTVVTAPSIPLFTAIAGDIDYVKLDMERAQFLKLREGWAAALPYINTMITGALLPYALARLFYSGSAFRFPAFILFLAYSVSFLNKALFLLVVTPLFYLFLVRKRYMAFAVLVLGCLAILYVNTKLATQQHEAHLNKPILVAAYPPETIIVPGWGSQETGFFGARYKPANKVDFIVWRIVAVPVFTAADALYVFKQKYDAKPLLGATSSFLAKLTGAKRITFEQDVYFHQWGPSEYGRANTFFLIEAFVNFGWAGVVVFSLFVGQSLRWFYKTEDEAAKSLWPLYAFYFLMFGGLIAILLSNAYLLLFAILLFVRITPKKKPADQVHPELSPA